MKLSYKQLLSSAIFLSVAFLQVHSSSFAADNDVVSEISEGSKITNIEFEGNHSM